MNIRRNKAQGSGVKRTGYYPKRQPENQKSYFHNWDRNVAVRTIPIPRRIRKGA